MTYNLIIERFVHPFIIYVIIGTLISYILAYLLARTPVLKDSRSKALIYSIPFLVPFAAFLFYRPFIYDKCLASGHRLGSVNSWLCTGGEALAVILTPLFGLVAFFAVAKAGLSLYACSRIVKRFGYATAEEYPELFRVLEELCDRAGIRMPKVIVTGDSFARSFTMGYRPAKIVFSQGLLSALDDEELETVIAHELGHISRVDSVLTWVIVFMRDLMFFNPLIYWIFRDLASEKEKASDDIAISLTGKPMAFAHALIKVWKMSPRTLFDNILLDNFMPHPNFVSNAGILEHRVKRIINREHAVLTVRWFANLVVPATAVLSVALLYWFC